MGVNSILYSQNITEKEQDSIRTMIPVGIGNEVYYHKTYYNGDTLRCFNSERLKIITSDAINFEPCENSVNEKEEEIYLLTELLEEKHDQLQISELLINSQRNEIEKLQQQRTVLGVGLGVSIVGLLLALLR